MKIALTGGIACGKSLLSRYLNELGVETLDADDVAHELVSPEERKRLARIVFRDPAARKRLEARLHPAIRDRIDAWFASPSPDSRSSGPDARTPPRPKIKIAVIPLLFEVHWDADYDIIACVVSSREKQIERMTAMRGYSRDEAIARLSAQLDAGVKASKSSYAIHNDGTPEDLRMEAKRFVEWLSGR